MEVEPASKRIAVIGSGAAGLAACFYLQKHHLVTLLEKEKQLGGHIRTEVIPNGPDEGAAVDMGFIVLNDRTYPEMHQLLKALQVPVRYSDMSFSYHCAETGLQYASRNLNVLFAQRRNLFRLSFLKMLHDISLFWKRSRVALQRGALSGETLGVYLAKNRFSQSFVRDFVAPLGAAIWSCPAIHLMDFPAETFFKFFENHGFLSYSGQPRWQTVVGGSSAYVDAILRKSRIEVLLNSRLRGVRRSPDGPVLIDHNGAQRQFDAVVIATHADQALQLLLDPSPSETRILGAWRYENNHAVLHSSLSYLPPERRAWASWNYKRERGEREDSSISITYHMNRLQGLNCANEYCVTLNPRRMIDQRGVISEVRFSHPVYNFDSIRSQRELASLQGQRRTWYCGSYFGYGFHEDAIRAGHSAAQAILDARWH